MSPRHSRKPRALFRKKILFLAIAAAALAVLAIALPAPPAHRPLEGLELTLYKPEYCECCDRYAEYLRSLGARVDVVALSDIDSLMDTLGIPKGLRSCHVSIVEGYLVVGHIPAEAIEKLLSERPSVRGISLPGMPPSSPGMPGPREEPLTIYSFNGEARVYIVV